MSLKTLLVVFSGEANELGALHTAFALAREQSGALRILHIADALIFYGAITNYGETPPVGLEKIDVLEKEARDLTEQAQTHATAAASHHGFALHVEGSPEMAPIEAQFRTSIGTSRECLPQQGRTVDLIVAAYDNSPFGNLDTLLAALFQTGRPVLAVPRSPGRNFGAGHFPNTVVVAWDGSLAAGRAVRDAVPLMQYASAVYVVCAMEGPTTLDVSGEADVVAYLHSHAVSPEIIHLPKEPHGVGAMLLVEAARLGADLIVMGAYGVSHIGEMVLGGATDHVLKHATLPLLLSH